MIKQEAPISEDLLKKVLAALSSESVLVGGQALAFWVNHYHVALPAALSGAISDDADILGTKEDVLAIAQKAHGVAELQPQGSLSALIGHVTIPIAGDSFVNVDILHKLIGIKATAVREHASTGKLDGITFRVMHPIDVLISRTENLAKIPEKQNEEGISQLRLAIMVAAQYIRELSEYPDDGQKHAMKVIERIVTLAKSSSGKKCMEKFDVNFLNALPGFAISNSAFQQIRWPQIVQKLGRNTPVAK